MSKPGDDYRKTLSELEEQVKALKAEKERLIQEIDALKENLKKK